MIDRRRRTAWLLGNAVALAAFVLVASHWWLDGELARVGRARGLAAYLNSASTLPLLLLSEVGKLLILAIAGVTHLAASARRAWVRDGKGLAVVALTAAAWVVAAAVWVGVEL